MTSPVLMPAGHKIIAADLDAYENLTGAWTSYTLTWTATSVNPSIGNGSISARYMRAGNFIVYTARIVPGSTTTFGTGEWRVSLPATSQASSLHTGTVTVYDDSTLGNRKSGSVWLDGTTLARFNSDTGAIDATNPFTWATSDRLIFSLVYEAA